MRFPAASSSACASRARWPWIPEVLLLDEPCSALDPIATAKIEDLLVGLKDQCTIVIVTHNMQQAARVADTTGFFLLGRLIEHDKTDVIFKNPSEEGNRRLHHGPFRLDGEIVIAPIRRRSSSCSTIRCRRWARWSRTPFTAACLSLVEKNEDYAHQVMRDESRIDQMEIQIDDMAASLIVREQPVARDMRFVVVAIKINTDLERMGDLAVDMVGALAVPDGASRRFPKSSTSARSRIWWNRWCSAVWKLSSSAMPSLARGILESDDAVDKARNAIQRQMIELMQRDPATVEPRARLH